MPNNSDLTVGLAEEASRHYKAWHLLERAMGRITCLEHIINSFHEAGLVLTMEGFVGQSRVSIMELQNEFPHVKILLNGEEVKEED